MATPVYTPIVPLTSPDVNQQTNFRVLVKMAAASNGQLRVTFRTGGGGSGLGIVGASIGKWDNIALGSNSCDMTTAPHRLHFEGLNDKLIPPNSIFTSDWVTHSNFTLAAGDWLIIAFKTNYDAYQMYSNGNNVTTMYKVTSTDYSQAQTATAMGGSVSLTGTAQPGSPGGYNFDIDLVETNDLSGSGDPFKVWNGTSWVSKAAKVWSGSAWLPKPVKVWSGSTWVTEGGSAIAAPTGHLVTAYTPGAGRDDFTGEVGARLNILSDLTVSWIGAMYAGGVAAPRKVNIYEWFADALVRSATIDLTGKAIGEWGWAQIEPITLLASGGYYAVLAEVVAGSGATWSNTGAVTMKPVIGNIYSTYRSPGGGMIATGPGESYVGVDLGW